MLAVQAFVESPADLLQRVQRRSLPSGRYGNSASQASKAGILGFLSFLLLIHYLFQANGTPAGHLPPGAAGWGTGLSL